MLASAVLTTLLAAVSTANPIVKRNFPYGSVPVRGANLGGWLLLEPWITPSIFERFGGAAIDEYTLTQNVPEAEQVLRNHWDTWVSLGDFEKIAQNGFNLVRIPIGYWAFQKFEGDPYIQGAADYLDTAIQWARQTGLKVSIDMHGAPLSQNGFDNSGQATLNPGFTQGNTIAHAVEVIGIISRRYGTPEYADVVVGIDLVNEPYLSILEGGQDALQSYYQQSYDVVRQSGQTPVIFSDGFLNPSEWNGFLTGRDGGAGAIIDHHQYHVFSNKLLAFSPEDHVYHVYSSAEDWAQGQDKFVIVGEWSGAMTDCATFLNGVGHGARYDGTLSKQHPDGSYETSNFIGSCADKNDIARWDQGMRTATADYIRAQLNVYENQVQGWIFWNFKTEGAAEWDLFRLIDNGVWPGFP